MPLMGVLFAITLSLKDYPASIQSEAEFNFTAGLECSKCGDSYLRAVFFPSGSNYFGFTQNHLGEWVATTSDKTQYFLVNSDQVQSGTWSGQIRAKPDIDSSDYHGPGEYSFKLIRYTASGSKSAETDPVTIQILGPTITPVPPSNSPKPTNIPPTKIPSAPPTLIPSPNYSPTPLVLGITDIPPDPNPSVISTPEPTISLSSDPQSPPVSWPAWPLITFGLIGLVISTFVVVRGYTRGS